MTTASALSLNFMGAPDRSEPRAGLRLVDDDPLASLVAAVRNGELRAFDALYHRTRGEVHRVLFQLVGHNADMEDLIQQVYVQLLSAIRSYRGEARFSTFLHRVCANIGMMYLRSRYRRREDPVAELPERAAGESSNPERVLHQRQAAALMQQVLERMTPKKKVVFVYHELLGMTAEEIAEAVETSPNTVRSRLHHARLEFVEISGRLRKAAGV